MAFCANCGSSLTEAGGFCNSCGVAAVSANTAQSGFSTAGASVGIAAPVSSTVESSGIPNNIAALLCYLVGPLAGIVFLMIEPYKSHRWVRFHAFQSIFLFVGWMGLWIMWAMLSAVLEKLTGGLFALITLPIDMLLGLGGLAYWIFLMYKAYSDQKHEIPFVGPLAQQQADK